MNIRSQVSMVFHLDKCIGCHTCSVACKNVWTDRKGAEYMWWNNVETKPGTGYPDEVGRPGEVQGRLGVQRQRQAATSSPRARRRSSPTSSTIRTCPAWTTTTSRGPTTTRICSTRQGRFRPADRRTDLDDRRREDRRAVRPELGRRPGRLADLRRERSEPGRTDRTAAAAAQFASSDWCSSTCRASATTA